MTRDELQKVVCKHADYSMGEGFAATPIDEVFEEGIAAELLQHQSELPESVLMLLLGLLVIFEMRRREARCDPKNHH